MREKKNRSWLCLLILALALLCAGPACALTEVSELEPVPDRPGGMMARIAGLDWEGFKNELLKARKDGRTDVQVLLNGETFREFVDTAAVWYHAARAGVMKAACTYSESGQVRLKNIRWWPWPMYLAETREDFEQAVRRSETGQVFGVLPGETFFREFLEDNAMRSRLLCLSGMIDCKQVGYDEESCALWFEDPQITEITAVEASGAAACAEALRETMLGNPSGMIALATDEATFQALEQDENLMDQVMSAAGLFCSYSAYVRAKVFLFPTAEEACYPGFRIAQAVRQGRERELSMDLRLALAKARTLVRDVSGTDMEKALQIHDLLCRHISYTVNEKTELDDCCVGALLNGKANCDGYSDAFYLCASLCGLDVRYISGDFEGDGEAEEEGSGHLWNLICLDGTWRSVDLTWDDDETYGSTCQYFNIGLDWLEETYAFSRELLPEPFLETTDLSWFSGRVRTAGSWEELTEAAARAAESGEKLAAVRCPKALLERMEEDGTLLYYAASARGALVNKIYILGNYVCLDEIEPVEPWSFCSVREEITQAALRLREKEPESFYLTIEKDLYDELIAQEQPQEFFRLLAKGGVLSFSAQQWDGSRMVRVMEAEWYTGYYAENIRSAVRLSQAISAGIREGYGNFYFFLSEPLYQELMEDPSRLSRAVRESGLQGAWSYDAWDTDFSVYIYSKEK